MVYFMEMQIVRLLCLCLMAASALSAFADTGVVSVVDLPLYQGKGVQVRGFIRDVFADERDINYSYLVLQTDEGPVYVAVSVPEEERRAYLYKLINAEVVVRGNCFPSNTSKQPRRHLGYFLIMPGTLSEPDLTILTPAPLDPFLVPTIDDDTDLGPFQLQQLGRRNISGKVLAVWGHGNVLLQTRTGRYSHIELAGRQAPGIGDFIEAVGFLDTDVYRLNLTRAIWRPTDPWPTTNATAKVTSAAKILTDGKGNPLVDTGMYGRLIRLTGTIQTLPGDAGDGIVRIDNGGYVVPVDASACPAVLGTLSVGCRLQATGICLFDIGNCRPNDIFPQARGLSLVLREPNDVTILSRPPWWTARRLSLALVAAVAVLVAVLVWNRSLSVLAERRGRQLADEQIQRAGTELKVLERTRLSVDLHDALSQTLSGIAMQLGAIKRFAATDPARMARHLDIASRTLKSCRDEMRNLLWDLRSHVLDEPDIEKAIRQIIEPHTDEADVRIRFTVPRAQLTDTTARNLFCIIRELVTNAIRHGHATAIRIAGSLENRRLLCSVRDNGSGFDPRTAPGAENGHFGLQGIRERIEAANGDLTVESSPGNGAKVTLSMPAPADEDTAEDMA